MTRILVSGATGFIGRALTAHLARQDHTVHRLVRGEPADGDAGWGAGAGDPLDLSRMPGRSLDGVEAVVHLAGAGIAAKRWSDERRREIRDSRVATTAKLAKALAATGRRPAVLVSASAVGWYGNRADEELDEDSEPGTGFLASLCKAWEAATRPAEEAGIRTAHVRTGIVLGPGGGTMEPLVNLFKVGLGGPVGNGRQWVSWISLADEIRAIERILADDQLAGPVNLVAPAPVTNATLVREIGHALHRPAVARAPAAALRLMMGRQMADELLLASQRVLPSRLDAAGFVFEHAELAGAVTSAVIKT